MKPEFHRARSSSKSAEENPSAKMSISATFRRNLPPKAAKLPPFATDSNSKAIAVSPMSKSIEIAASEPQEIQRAETRPVRKENFADRV